MVIISALSSAPRVLASSAPAAPSGPVDAFEVGEVGADTRLSWLRHGLPVGPELIGSPELSRCCGEGWAGLEPAYRFAQKAHAGQLRDDGSPYYHHPARVMRRLVEDFGVTDPATLQAALLHDVVEDTGVTSAQLGERFGSKVGRMVSFLSKPDPAPGQSYAERNQLYLDRMVREAPEGTVAVKLADRCDNIEDLHLCPDRTMIARYLTETREHYLPLARARFPEVGRRLEARLNQVERWFNAP